MLDHTPQEIRERSAVKINPVNICQPIGAAFAAAGLRNCMPHSHGSQGCSSYLRTQLTRHYREPVMGTSSSFSEDTAVFGGGGNLKQAIRNIIAIYKPEVIAVHTTCVAETIGDDVRSIIDAMEKSGDIPEEVAVIAASTPSYVGTHILGYARMVESMVNAFATADEDTKKQRINVIPGFNAEPGDIREIKRILALMQIDFILFPDTSDAFGAPLTGTAGLYPEGGTTIDELRQTGGSRATFVICRDSGELAAAALERKCGVPAVLLPTPVGIADTDTFIMKLAEITGSTVPVELETERGRLVDMMHDAHPHFHGKRVAIAGDPDIVSGMTSLAVGLGMEPVHILSGTRSAAFERESARLLQDFPRANAVNGGDLFTLHQLIKNEPVDLLLGNSHCKYIARAEDLPLIRIGFPISDRANLHQFPVMGYAGAARMVERIGNTLLDRLDRDAPEERYELLL
ncbi:MAG: nitrogenase molybdenum-iron protein subunit beta [Actinomycetota bacterium]|jgi:nitrogenase molybdenum-iron protein beta chain|nr:nitrogenase molybdenum-iron protein subunit beta [Actinomycetota bacterium]MCL6092567.1 nitrogenase molybdenum-iron protein subunit beta [Actinomycetota bacterium]MDA8166859.1 nitrogenase molybdenum-iron protein subunit beta [Actinomycetota bacterium]